MIQLSFYNTMINWITGARRENLMEDVTFIIPAYNEEQSIGTLLNNIQQLYPDSSIIVIDNNSTDKTRDIAKNYNITLLSEKKQGKGNAVRTGFKAVETKYALMLDADNTYCPHEAKRLLRPLISNKADVAMGSRLKGKKENGAITRFNIIGNYALSFTASKLYTSISDVCTGYWAFRKEVIDYLLENGIASNGFELEAEMFIKVSKGNFRIWETPIEYRKRSDITKLHSMKDGWKIFKTLVMFRFADNTQNKEIQEESSSTLLPPYFMILFVGCIMLIGFLDRI